MGQYYRVVNPTLRQFLHPHVFDDGLKLMEFGCSASGTMTALAVLLSSGNGRGGGDFLAPANGLRELVGSWAGFPVAIAGDYDDKGTFIDASLAADLNRAHREGRMPGWTIAADQPIERQINLYDATSRAFGIFHDISGMMVELLLAGGEPIRFDKDMVAKYDSPDRARRCEALARAMPYHPINRVGAY